MRVSPLGNGHVSEEDFHHLVCVPPRDIGIVLKIIERDALSDLIEAYRRALTGIVDTLGGKQQEGGLVRAFGTS